jgi:hypothetical protein
MFRYAEDCEMISQFGGATNHVAATKLAIRGEKAPVTQGERLRIAADTRLISAL